jgi:chromosome segregation and condensation protein ScpB
MDRPRLDHKDSQVLAFIDKYHQGLSIEQVTSSLGSNASQIVTRLLQMGFLERAGGKFRTLGEWHN